MFVLALLLLGLVMQPVLGLVGELHELDHAAVVDPDGMADASQGRTPDASDPLHALIHFAHCCGHSPLASPAVAVLVAASPSADRPPMAEAGTVPRSPSLAPFRPPITA